MQWWREPDGGMSGEGCLEFPKKKNLKNCFCRTHSLREDASSELQGVISVEGGHVPESQASSFTGRGAMAR